MIRSTLLAGTTVLIALGGCSGSQPAPAGNDMANMATDNLSIEDVPSDGLSAPADMPLDRESNGVDGARSGNAM